MHGFDIVEVVIEVSRGDHIKRDGRGVAEFLSPLPCPFNYGSVVDSTAEDGDPIDAVVLGSRLDRGQIVAAHVVGVVAFVDAGQRDDKWVCSNAPMTRAQRTTLRSFFVVYAVFKKVFNVLMFNGGTTRFKGLKAPVSGDTQVSGRQQGSTKPDVVA